MAGADAVATYEVNLKDGVAGPSVSAEKALESLRGQLNKDQQALNQLNKAMKNLQSGTVVNVQQFKALDGQIKATKDRISSAQGAIVDLGGAVGKGTRPVNAFQDALSQLKQQAQGVGGPLGSAVGQFDRLKLLLGGGALALGVVGLVAGFAALTVAIIAATAALVAYGISQADARRNELLMLEGMTKMVSIWGIAAGNANLIQGAIDKVSASSALGRQEINQYATQLYKMGLRGQNLSDALEGVAIKASTQGQAAASQFMGLAQSIALTGGSVKALSDKVKQRLGGIAAKQMLSLGVISSKLKENFGRLFDLLPIEGVLKSFQSLASMFSLSTVTGQGLKTLMDTIFAPISAAIEYLTPIAKGFFQGMLIGVLQLTVWALKVAVYFKEAFGINIPKSVDMASAAVTAGKVAIGLLALGFVAAGAAAVALGAVMIPILWGGVTALWAMVAAGAAMAAPFILGGLAIAGVIAVAYQLYRLWQEIDWTDLGKSIVDGIVWGLKAAGKWLTSTMEGLAKSALDTFKGALGIHSPSKEFAKLGVQLPAGVRQGIERGTPALDTAVNEMVQPAGMDTGAAPAAKAGATTNSFHIDELHVHTTSSDGKGLAQDIIGALEEAWSGMLMQKGAPA